MEKKGFIGGYGKEIVEIGVDPDGGVRKIRPLDGVQNPSWILPHPNGRILYAVEELSPEGAVVALRIDGGKPVLAARLPSGGADPCHLALDEAGHYLAVSNYSGGSLGIYALDAEGIPVTMSDYIHYDNPSQPKNLRRQAVSHVHYAQWHRGVLYVCDLGWDLVRRYQVDAETGRLQDLGNPIVLPDGSGPRHLCFPQENSGCCYVLTEMTCTLYRCCPEGDGWSVTEEASMLPPDWSGDPSGHEGYGAAIHYTADGRFLLVSCRVVNTLHVFSIGENGHLHHCCAVSSGGETPRDFAILDDWVLVGNQDSGELRVYQLNRTDGKLIPRTATLPAAGITCIAFL